MNRTKKKKVKCRNCQHLMYSPPWMREIIKSMEYPFDCLSGVFNGEDDPAEIDKKRKCKKYTKADIDQFSKEEKQRVINISEPRKPKLRRKKVAKPVKIKLRRIKKKPVKMKRVRP